MTGKPFNFNKDLVAPVYITVLAVIALVYGFTIVPSPQTERNRAIDHKRVSDLGNLQLSIDNYYTDNGVLPSALSILKPNDPSTPLNRTDPQTKQPYVYTTTSPSAYKLCATFLTDSSKEDPTTYDDNNPDYSSYKNDFKHSVGYHCFSKDENGDNSNPQTYCTGSGCPNVPTDTPLPNPTVSISSFDNKGNCDWIPTFHLTGFDSYMQITAAGTTTLDNSCSQKPNQQTTEVANLPGQTNANGDMYVAYPNQLGYGDYNLTFSDSDGNTASIHFVYEPPATGPTIIPSTPTPMPGGGGSGGAGL